FGEVAYDDSAYFLCSSCPMPLHTTTHSETPDCLHRYLETPFSGHRARHEALDYFAGYAAVTVPTVVIPDQRTTVTIRPRHHGLVGHVCPHAIKPDFVVTSRLVLCLPVTRFDVRRV